MHIPTPSNPVPTCLRPPGALGVSENEEGAPSELPSLRSLVRRHARFVGRLAAETGVRSGDVDDVVQAVLLIAWHHLRRGGELPQAKAWLRTVTKRVAWAHNRAVLARAELLVGDMPGEGMGYPEDLLAPSAEEVHESMAAIQLVREVVARLRPERRVVFVRYELLTIARNRGNPVKFTGEESAQAVKFTGEGAARPVKFTGEEDRAAR